MAAKRFTVRDVLAGQNPDLIGRGDRRRRERWIVYDNDLRSDYSDGYASKRAAQMEAKDLNAGLYGPLAERTDG